MNFSLLTFDILDSTNTEALKQARLGAEEGVCVIARQQTAGRGRYGRTWVSERDAGLYFSIILRPKMETHCLPLITLMAGIAVHDTLKELGARPDIKWVNDILVNEKKIAGILAEATETEEGLAVIVGIGINLTPANFPPDLVAAATCLEDILPTPPRPNEVVDVLNQNLASFYETLQSDGGPSKIIENWKNRSSYTIGKVVRVVLENEIMTGVTDGLESNGGLRIKRGDGSVSIIQAGDVEQVRAAN
ncbi:MAG TPA: biotin--[acetyl-CoA-carboxylase] ligase [Pyrinomonadaceae bacterium]|nr:biotin--[acetyl-CoA-carboxylase] ligase [Pyrinomonadaceae bacterium]